MHPPHEALYYYHVDQLQAVRSGPWKLYVSFLRRSARDDTADQAHAGTMPERLFNVVEDPKESRNLHAQHPALVARLAKLAAVAREELGDVDRPGRGQRAAGWVADPRPQRMTR